MLLIAVIKQVCQEHPGKIGACGHPSYSVIGHSWLFEQDVMFLQLNHYADIAILGVFSIF